MERNTLLLAVAGLLTIALISGLVTLAKSGNARRLKERVASAGTVACPSMARLCQRPRSRVIPSLARSSDLAETPPSSTRWRGRTRAMWRSMAMCLPRNPLPLRICGRISWIV